MCWKLVMEIKTHLKNPLISKKNNLQTTLWSKVSLCAIYEPSRVGFRSLSPTGFVCSGPTSPPPLSPQNVGGKKTQSYSPSKKTPPLSVCCPHGLFFFLLFIRMNAVKWGHFKSREIKFNCHLKLVCS